MYRFWLLAAGAGLVSAAAFLIGIRLGLGGSYPGLMLVYLSPAPVFGAALGLGGSAGFIAAAAGLVLVALVNGIPDGLGYAVLAAAPAAILGRQAMLSRSNEAGGVEWYPPGALAGWLCGIGAAALTLLCVLLASQPPGLSGTVREMLMELAAWMKVPDDDLDLFVGFLHPILPGASVAFFMLLQVANGALAQALLSASRRALRPAPDLGALELPGWIATGGAVAALAAILLGGDYGYYARNLVFVAAVPFFLQGLSVVHVLARKTGGGAMLLAVFYVTLVLLAWVSIMLVLLGLVEQIVGLRRRMNSEDKA